MLGLQKYDKNNFIRIIRILITFILVTFAWIFFRMTNLNAAIDVVCKIFTDLEPSIYMTGSHIQDLLIVTPLLVVILKDWIEEFSNFSLFHNKFRIIRWCSYFAVLFYILLFGVFDASSFIYANF